MYTIKLRTGEMYQFQTDRQVNDAVNDFLRQGVHGNVYQSWGHSRYMLKGF